MIFSLTLTINHPKLEPIEHVDMITAVSKSALLKNLNLPAKRMTDLKNKEQTSWQDEHGAIHTLVLKQEAH